MTTDVLLGSQPRSLSGALRRGCSGEPLFAGAARGLLALMVPTVLAMCAGPAHVPGHRFWIKPFKFQFALAIYLLTLAVTPAGCRRA